MKFDTILVRRRHRKKQEIMGIMLNMKCVYNCVQVYKTRKHCNPTRRLNCGNVSSVDFFYTTPTPLVSLLHVPAKLGIYHC